MAEAPATYQPYGMVYNVPVTSTDPSKNQRARLASLSRSSITRRSPHEVLSG